MDYKTLKVLNYINKNDSKNFTLTKLIEVFPRIPKDHLIEIVNYLYQNKYIKYVGVNSYIKSKNKGKMFFYTSCFDWLSKNIIAILALIVSIWAFIRTF